MSAETIFFKNKWLAWLILILAYLAVSIYNGYPVLYSDTSTYISSGFELDAPADRPIMYGILLRLFSLNGLSLFLVPVFQSSIFLFALYNLLALFFEKQVVLKYLFLLSCTVLLFTGFGWSLNLLLPDIFTSIGFIFLFCILVSRKKPKEQVLLFILFFLSASSHISNLFVFFIVTLCAFIIKRWFIQDEDRRMLKYKFLVVLGILGISYLLMGSAISKSRHVFMMGNMAQKGILQEVLNDNCATSQFKLCAYKDSIPRSFDYFVWDTKSPLYLMGGWKATKDEYRKIVSLSFSNSRYISMHVKQSSINFINQLGKFGIGEGNVPFGNETKLIQRIQHYTVLDQNCCLNTRQHRGEFMNMEKINGYYKIVMCLAVVLLIFLLVSRFKKLSLPLRSLVFLTIILIISNSALVAFTSEVSNRFGCKISWLVILLDFVILMDGHLFKDRKAPTT